MTSSDGWRYIAQRFDGNSGGLGEFLDFNVPLTGANIEDVLSGHNSLTGTISPEYPRLKGPDGRPILEEYGSALWAETPDGEIYGGLLTHSGFDEDGQWSLECTDLTGISLGLPYADANFWVNVDPMDLFRYIWTNIQSQPNSNVGLTIDPTTSPVRLGTDLIERVEFDTEADPSAADPTQDIEPTPQPAPPNRYANNSDWRDAAVKIMKANGWHADVVDDALRKWLNKDALVESKKWTPLTDKEKTIRDRSIDKIGWPPNPPQPGHSEVLTGFVNVRRIVDMPTGTTTPAPADPTTDPAENTPVFEADAYKLNWYTNLDLASDIDSLAGDTPFDWHVVHWWDEQGDLRHHIRLGYPRLGRRREELRFVVGENILTAPSVERDGAEYANEILVMGAGEGSTQKHGRAYRREDGRIRKVITISDPSLKTDADCIARASSELAKRFNIDDIADVVLIDHPHAPLGSVDLGDEILVEGDIGWIDFSAWCRVVSRTMSPDDGDAMTLTLIRSDRLD